MLCALIVIGGFLLALCVCGAIVELTPLSRLIDRATQDLPMMWCGSRHEYNIDSIQIMDQRKEHKK